MKSRGVHNRIVANPTDQHWWYGIVNGADQLSRGQQIEGKAYFDVGVVQPSKLKSKTNFVLEPTDIYIYIYLNGLIWHRFTKFLFFIYYYYYYYYYYFFFNYQNNVILS